MNFGQFSTILTRVMVLYGKRIHELLCWWGCKARSAGNSNLSSFSRKTIVNVPRILGQSWGDIIAPVHIFLPRNEWWNQVWSNANMTITKPGNQTVEFRESVSAQVRTDLVFKSPRQASSHKWDQTPWLNLVTGKWGSRRVDRNADAQCGSFLWTWGESLKPEIPHQNLKGFSRANGS